MADTPTYPPNVQQLINRAQDIYNQKLKSTLEPNQNGKYVVIEPDSEEHFLGDTREQAVTEARKKYPDKLVVVIRIGGIEKVSRHSSRITS